jgi:hypothetical protein
MKFGNDEDFGITEAPWDRDGGGGGTGSTSSDRPTDAPQLAAAELAEYDRRLRVKSRRLRRQAGAVILLTLGAAIVGLFTAVTSEPMLGVASGILAACATAIESWRAQSGDGASFAAHKVAHSQLEGELDHYNTKAGEYAVLTAAAADAGAAQAARDEHLVMRITEINRTLASA